jgi:hypothetical protein
MVNHIPPQAVSTVLQENGKGVVHNEIGGLGTILGDIPMVNMNKKFYFEKFVKLEEIDW